MTIRTDADIRRLREKGALSTAEETLIDNCRAGEPTRLGDGKVPARSRPARRVHADLLRYLITGGCAECPTQDVGVHLTGAYVTGTLDLKFATAKGETALLACRFEKPIEALQARFEFLSFTDSHLPGLNAQGAHVTGDVFLHRVIANGEVRLSNARIGGHLTCAGAMFENPARFHSTKCFALNAQYAEVKRNVNINKIKVEGETRKFEAKGQVSLSGAKIGGQLVCEGAQFDTPGGFAFSAGNMEVLEFHWRGVKAVTGRVDLSSARVEDLADDAASWAYVEHLNLNGFRYERMSGQMTVQMRLDWVAKDAATIGEFRPQPYEQLARVYKAMGHEADWRRVLIEKETLQRADERKRFSGFWGRLKRPWKWTWDFLSWLVVGYGYRPFQVISAFFILWAVGSGMAHHAWHSGGFAPNSYAVLSSPEWQVLAEDGGVDNPAEAWSAKHGAGRDWESFNSAAYAFDVVVPIVTIGQTEAWAPSTTRGAWGLNMWWARWALTVLGWIVTAVGAAAITGIIRRE